MSECSQVGSRRHACDSLVFEAAHPHILGKLSVVKADEIDGNSQNKRQFQTIHIKSGTLIPVAKRLFDSSNREFAFTTQHTLHKTRLPVLKTLLLTKPVPPPFKPVLGEAKQTEKTLSNEKQTTKAEERNDNHRQKFPAEMRESQFRSSNSKGKTSVPKKATLGISTNGSKVPPANPPTVKTVVRRKEMVKKIAKTSSQSFVCQKQSSRVKATLQIRREKSVQLVKSSDSSNTKKTDSKTQTDISYENKSAAVFSPNADRTTNNDMVEVAGVSTYRENDCQQPPQETFAPIISDAKVSSLDTTVDQLQSSKLGKLKRIKKCKRRWQQDRHEDMGDWMKLVDATVAENAASFKGSPIENLQVVRESLGTLALMAASASALRFQSDPEIRSEHSHNVSMIDCGANVGHKQVKGALVLTPRPYQQGCEHLPKSSLRNLVVETPQPLCTPAGDIHNENMLSRSIHSRPPREQSYQRHETTSIQPYLLMSSQKNGQRKRISTLSAIHLSNSRRTPSATRTPFKGTIRTPASRQRTRHADLIGVERSNSLRGPVRRRCHPVAMLLKGIRMCNPNVVIEAVEKHNADPNEYIDVPSSNLPWTLLSPIYEEKKDQALQIPSRIRLHPLHLAVAVSSVSVTRALIDCGACPNALDHWTRNPLHVILQPPYVALPENYDSESSTFTSQRSQSETAPFVQLSTFLLAQVGARSPHEAHLATLLCDSGIDIERRDFRNRTCLDYATTWLHIEQLIRNKNLICPQFDRSTTMTPPIIESISRSGTPKMVMAFPTFSGSLDTRVPHSVVDVVFLHSDRLRLEAMESIVGVDIGGNNPTWNVSIHPERKIRNRPQALQIAMAQDETKIEERPNALISFQSLIVKDEGRQSQTNFTPQPQSVETSHPHQRRRSSWHKKLNIKNTAERHVMNTLEKGNYCLSGFTLLSPSPGVTKVLLQTSPNPVGKDDVAMPIDQIPVPSHNELAQGCLNLLQSSSKSKKYNQKNQRRSFKSGTTSDDLEVFLKLAASPAMRHHPALSGVWEFLGAQLFPKSVSTFKQDHADDTKREAFDALELSPISQPMIIPLNCGISMPNFANLE